MLLEPRGTAATTMVASTEAVQSLGWGAGTTPLHVIGSPLIVTSVHQLMHEGGSRRFMPNTMMQGGHGSYSQLGFVGASVDEC